MNLIKQNDDSSQVAVLMLHGRGSNAEDIIGLSSVFKSLACYAFTANYNQWYPKPFNMHKNENEPFLSESLNQVDEAYNTLKKKHSKVYLLGFSQGACLALEYASKKIADGVIAFSGGLIGADNELNVNISDTKVFVSCSKNDPFIPLDRAQKTQELFQTAGNNVTSFFYEGSTHMITSKEIDYAIDFFDIH